ncbi:GNAT family N-acetyltransferase [Acinetobacter higginsii]|uniref:GNAT family N-acetyltransferase n=1 Tax=Acinetobacter higginsii TaxID=70347 RepID=UPI001F4A25D2|nr:GNAT family N-acetyltransferase [Acinetobacter higginsii]
MIIPAKAEHSLEVLNVIKESILSCTLDHEGDTTIIHDWLENKTEENVSEWIKNNICFLYCFSGKVVGFICMSRHGNLFLNYILPAFQNQGVGEKLLKHQIEYCKMNNIHMICLESTLTAVNFYKKHNFKVNRNIIENEKTVAYEMLLHINV